MADYPGANGDKMRESGSLSLTKWWDHWQRVGLQCGPAWVIRIGQSSVSSPRTPRAIPWPDAQSCPGCAANGWRGSGCRLHRADLVDHSPPLALIAVVLICRFGAKILVSRNYGAALVFNTPVTLTVGQLGSPSPANALVINRIAETVLGAVVGIVLVLIARWNQHHSERCR